MGGRADFENPRDSKGEGGYFRNLKITDANL